MSATARRASLIGLLCATLAASACQTPEPPAPPPPPPPPLPTISLNASVAEAAAVYLAYMSSTSHLTADFANGGQVRQSMLQAAAYEPVQLSRGMVAYAAVVALQSPEFVNGVRGLAADPANRDILLRRIIQDPSYVTQLPGASHAAGLIASQLQGNGSQVYAAGAAIKQMAYDVQRQRWSTQHVTDRESRLEQVRVLGITPLSPDLGSSSTLQQAALSGQGLGFAPADSQPPYTQTVIRGMALAAIAALGQAGDDNRVLTDALLNEPVSADCLSFTRLMILQCLAASRPQYEEIFCLGQHLMMDTGQCVIDSAGTFSLSPTATQALTTAPGTTLEPIVDGSQSSSSDAQTPN